MAVRVNFSIAKVHLLSRKRQTVIAMLGVVFGIAMFILMISFMKGVNQFLQDTMLASTPDVHIYNDIKTDYANSITREYFRHEKNVVVQVHHPKPKQINLNLKNVDGMLQDLKKNNEVAAVSPLLTTQVFYNYGPVQINGVIDGVNIEEVVRLFNLNEKMVTGRPENLMTTDNGILLGQSLANKLNVRMGDIVTLATPYGMSMRCRVAGTFAFGVGQIDNIKGYMTIGNAQQLMGKDPNYITDLQLKLKNINAAKAVAARLSAKYGYKAEDWESANSSIMASNIIRDVLTYVVSITLLVVAGFGIYNIMNMTIANKMKDIAILKAEGFNRRDIMQIFLAQSLFIGVLGSLIGIGLGFALSYALSSVPFPHNEFLSLKFFPVVFRGEYYVFGLLFGVLTTLFAGLTPSLKAAKVDPVVILRA